MTVDLQWCAAHLRSCNASCWILKGRQLHQLLLKAGFSASIFTANCLLQMYARCGTNLSDALLLFDEMIHRNCFSWNSLIDACIKFGDSSYSVQLFDRMPRKNEYSWNAIITGLVRLGDIGNAWRLFEDMPMKDAIALNSLLHGYFRSGRAQVGFSVYKRLNSGLEEHSSLCLDAFVLATVISACAEYRTLHLGKQIHSQIVVSKVELDAVLGSALVDMYGKCEDMTNARKVLDLTTEQDEFSLSALITGFVKCGRYDEARRIFYSRPDPGIVLWNSMITGYASYGHVEEALALFEMMMRKGVYPDSSTSATILSACASLGALRNVLQIHANVLKYGFLDGIIVGSALVDSYSKAGDWDNACKVFGELKVHDTVLLNLMIKVYSSHGRIAEARQVFDEIQGKTVISWNSMIVGYNQNGFVTEALDLFSEMRRSAVGIDEVTLASVISASASICSLGFGEQGFALALVWGFDSDQIISTSLVDLYCKCGFMTEGWKIFVAMRKLDEAPWNSMLMGYASNGMGSEVLRLFEAMKNAGVAPNEVTFIAVLSACCHCGLVDEGLRWFYCMKDEFGLNPFIEHYSCIVGLLVRAGRVEEALDFINDMPFEADASMLTSLLGGCKVVGNDLLADKVAKRLIELSPSQSSSYVQISSIYAANGDWHKSQSVRSLMCERRIRKNPGFSWIDR
ncbi:putative pentatricopeptide repeat-containing protein At1g77010, mitochondrial [Phalaenopsis equestris]|uniref:putative pentatricopeptide repeat-containing protein At1g77010, mitochondrial n=1 Tax=Phalaenopsis equestris TaxID=78828 RepID=UPI0009E3E24E|nr:putative pentatricopeptide repeat-containing protein At1g77010, mitochondrial [Phalaenopsis equestris]